MTTVERPGGLTLVCQQLFLSTGTKVVYEGGEGNGFVDCPPTKGVVPEIVNGQDYLEKFYKTS